MPSIQLSPPSGRFLSFAEREEIALLKAQDVGVREIARRLGRSPSTVSLELRRNAATRCGRLNLRGASPTAQRITQVLTSCNALSDTRPWPVPRFLWDIAFNGMTTGMRGDSV